MGILNFLTRKPIQKVPAIIIPKEEPKKQAPPAPKPKTTIYWSGCRFTRDGTIQVRRCPVDAVGVDRPKAVYATPLFEYALIQATDFLDPEKIAFMTYQDKVFLIEMRRDKLHEIYWRSGKVCKLPHWANQHFKPDPFDKRGLIADQPIPVEEVRDFPYVYQELRRRKNVHMFFYPDLPSIFPYSHKEYMDLIQKNGKEHFNQAQFNR